MVIFSLAACGNNETPSGSEGDNPGVSQNGGEENKGTGLWDITDADIAILNEGHDVATLVEINAWKQGLMDADFEKYRKGE